LLMRTFKKVIVTHNYKSSINQKSWGDCLVFTCVRCGSMVSGCGNKLKINGEDVHPKEEYCDACKFQVTAVFEFGQWMGQEKARGLDNGKTQMQNRRM